MQERISKEEFLEWKNSRGTKQLVKEIYEKREALKEGIVEMSHSTDTLRFVDIGRTQGYKDIIDHIIFNLDYTMETQSDDLESGSAPDHS